MGTVALTIIKATKIIINLIGDIDIIDSFEFIDLFLSIITTELRIILLIPSFSSKELIIAAIRGTVVATKKASSLVFIKDSTISQEQSFLSYHKTISTIVRIILVGYALIINNLGTDSFMEKTINSIIIRQAIISFIVVVINRNQVIIIKLGKAYLAYLIG